MAKKKNAPVLRDGDNNQPAITKSYAVRDKWLDKAKDNLVEFKSVDGEISDLKVNGEPAGGGGGGGTAVVTFANEPTTFDAILPVLKNGKYMVTNGGAIDETTTFPAALTIPIPATGIWNGDNNPTCTGGISFDPDSYQLSVTGDGTITR